MKQITCIQRTVTEGEMYWVTCFVEGASDAVTCAFTWEGEHVGCFDGY